MSNDDLSAAELKDLDQELQEFDPDLFGSEAGGEELGELDELDEEIDDAGLGGLADDESFGEMEAIGGLEGLVQLGEEGDFEKAFIFGYLKKKAKRLIKKIYRIIKRYRACRKCIKPFLKAVRAYKKRKYGSAIWHAWKTVKCIRKCLKKKKQ